MTQCAACGEGTNMPYTCNYCGRDHCSKHKLPERHDCPNKEQANTLGPELRGEYRGRRRQQPTPKPQSPETDSDWTKLAYIATIVLFTALLTIYVLF